MNIRPIRLQLSRRKGFNLQEISRAANGLPAINVARPSKWGNPWRVGLISCSCRAAGECDHNTFRRENASDAVDAFQQWAHAWSNPRGKLSDIRVLAGKNLACWCKPGEPCHADVLLELANGSVAQSVEHRNLTPGVAGSRPAGPASVGEVL